MKKNTVVAAIGLSLLGILGASGCTVAAQSDEVFVHKGGGPLDSPEPKGCVQPATRELEKPFDAYYPYPANQRVYDFTGGENSDGEPFTVVSQDGQTLTIPGTLTFNLNTDCNILQKFHDKIGSRDGAYFEDGMQNTPKGWTKVLNLYMRPALDSTLDRIAKQYPWTRLYGDPTIKDELNKAVNESVRALVNQQLEGNDEFFLNYSALIQQPQAANDLVELAKSEEISKKTAANTEAKAKADAKAAEAAANSQVAQKKAELKVAELQAQIKAAEIAAFGGIQQYNNYKAIEKGLNPFQPTYNGGALVDTTK